MYRISSMYNHSRKIIALLIAVFSLEFVVLVTVNLYVLRFGTRKPTPTPSTLSFLIADDCVFES